MYAEHFGLSSDPFSLTPDPAFLYLSPDHREALAAVKYGLLDGRGFITLIGEVGTGKTTLLYSILSQRLPGLDAAYVSYSAQSFEGLLATALNDLGIQAAGTTKAALLEALNGYLQGRGGDRSTALVIDEAQNLSEEGFEELRLLSNFETYTRKLLQIVLVGQPELQERLRRPSLRQLRERVSVRAYVNPLSREEMVRYITHRLQLVGGDVERLFTPRALRGIVRRTGGIPRRANILCHNALLFAYGRDRGIVTHVEAREAVAEMDDRRPGAIPRRALRRVSFRPANADAWVWAAALGGAVAVGILASQLWSSLLLSPSRDVPAATALQPESTPAGALAAGAAVAATVNAVAPTPPAPEPAAPAAQAAAAPAAAPEEPAPVASAARAAAPVPEAAPPVAPSPSVADSREGEGGGGGVVASSTLSVVVPRGGALWHLLREAYGDQFTRLDRHALYARVRELNPQVTNVNMIIAGDRLELPLPTESGRGMP